MIGTDEDELFVNLKYLPESPPPELPGYVKSTDCSNPSNVFTKFHLSPQPPIEPHAPHGLSSR